MSSSEQFQPSSSLLEPPNHRRKSQFTYKHLAQLALSSSACPLRVIAHIDLDAFYAQCEMIRLGMAEDQPLAVRQWQGLIAINYPAKKFGLSRHATITDAKKLCPQLIMQHVATWKEGDDKWAYHEDAYNHIGTHKVSLDPYRLESRRILACIKEALPANLQRVEKASIDEVFLDLSAQTHSILLERYPELSLPPPYDDPTEHLPLPPTTALDWQADALVDLDAEETEEDDPDWDDIIMLIGSEIVRGVRVAVRQQLKYTCSAGIAHNKILSKLGSGHRKPNQQTVIRNRAVQQFMSDFKLTKIRNLGGKLGDHVVSTFNTDTVKDLLPITIEQLKKKLGDDTGAWVYQTIRGIDHSEVSSRTQIKSMLSAKSFRPSINNYDQAVRWLRIFVADIYSRLVEEGVLEHKRRPKTINLHYRQGGQTRSHQCPIPNGKVLDEATLFELAQSLLSQIILEGRVWPCTNLSLSVGGFEDGVSGNRGISAFLIKGDEAKALRSTARESTPAIPPRPGKRQRLDTCQNIHRFLEKTDYVDEHDDEFGIQHDNGGSPEMNEDEILVAEDSKKILDPPTAGREGSFHQQSMDSYICKRCKVSLQSDEALQSHHDWHFAKDLQAEDRKSEAAVNPRTVQAASKKRSSGPGKKAGPGGSSQAEKGQSKLMFG